MPLPEVPVLHEPADGPVEARLLFGVGSSDESAVQAGLTHLVEHLAVRGALPIAVPHNATTWDWVTEFEVTAASTTDALAALGRFTASIGRLLDTSATDVDRERRVLAAEGAIRYREQVPSVTTFRFGPRGPGLAGAGWAASHGLTAEEVRAWVARWFVAENAVVVVAGGARPEPTLAVALPRGQAAGPVPTWTGASRGGVLVESLLRGAAVSVLVPAQHAPLLEAVLEHELFRALRLEAALVYEVEAHSVVVDPAWTVVTVTLDPELDDMAAAVDIAVATVRRTAERGVPDESIGRIDAARAANHLDPAFRTASALSGAALLRLRGLLPPPSGASPLSPHELGGALAALRAALPGIIVCVDDDLEADLDELAARHDLVHEPMLAGRAVDRVPRSRTGGPVFRDAFLPGWATSRAQVDGNTLVIRRRGVSDRVVDLSSCAVVGVRGDDGLTVVDADGSLFQLRADDWWRGRDLIRAVRAATPAHLLRSFVP